MKSMNIAEVIEAWPKTLRDAVEIKIREFWEIDAKRPDVEQFDCADNFRIARIDDPLEVAAFNAAEADGCCGSHKEEWAVGGVLVLYGFNYGH